MAPDARSPCRSSVRQRSQLFSVAVAESVDKLSDGRFLGEGVRMPSERETLERFVRVGLAFVAAAVIFAFDTSTLASAQQTSPTQSTGVIQNGDVSPGALDVKYDRFEDSTQASLQLRKLSASMPHLTAILGPVIFNGRVPGRVTANSSLRICLADPATTMNPHCESFVLLIDGLRWRSTQSERGSPENSWALVSLGTLESIANAQSVEGRMGARRNLPYQPNTGT